MPQIIEGKASAIELLIGDLPEIGIGHQRGNADAESVINVKNKR
jgi:hypothetical protein